MNDIFEWQDDHHKALEGWRRFNRIFSKRVVEPKPDPPADGVIFTRLGKRSTTNALVKNVMDRKLPTKLTPEQIREQLYPRRQR